MALNFPNSPINGETYSENGVTWVYDSSFGAWFARSTANTFSMTTAQLKDLSTENSVVTTITPLLGTIYDLTIATSAFNKANAANVLAYNTGIGANAFTSATIAGANTAVGTGANAFTSATITGANTAVGTGANAFTSATIAGANTAVGTGANAFTSATIAGANTAVGTGANAFTSATITGANTAVGTGANAFTSATITGANTAVGTGANAFTSATVAGANNISIAAFNKANSALANTSGVTFAGNLNITGNVGISTQSPTATLDVSGSVSVAKANVVSQTLTDAATINWNTQSGQIATVTLAGNRTMAAPTNLRVGTYILHVIQDGTGGRTLTWNAIFKWPAGVAPVLTTTANSRDLFSFVCDGTNLYGSILPDAR